MKLDGFKTISALFLMGSNFAFSGSMGAISPGIDPKDGFYAGAGIGASFDNFKLNTKDYVRGYTVVRDANDSNGIANLFIGYGYTAPSMFYFGGELGSNFPSRAVTVYDRPGVAVSQYTYTNIFRVQDYLTLDLLPGYRFMPNALVYGRVGITYSKLSLRQPINSAAVTPEYTASDSRVGGRFGVGATYAFNEQFSGSIDYYFTTYQNANYTWPLYNINFRNSAYSNYLGASITYTLGNI